VSHLLIALLFPPLLAAQTTIPKAWDEDALRSMTLPLAGLKAPVKYAPADWYYRIPERTIYRSYPVYVPPKEPERYMNFVAAQAPETVAFDASKLSNEADWALAGESVFSSAGAAGFLTPDDMHNPDVWKKFHFKADWAHPPFGIVMGEVEKMPALPDHWNIIEEADAEHPFRLATSPSRSFLNTSFNETPSSQAREGKASVMIHPLDAAALGISDGDAVTLGNTRGETTLIARIFAGVRRGVLQHGEVSRVARPVRCVHPEGRQRPGGQRGITDRSGRAVLALHGEVVAEHHRPSPQRLGEARVGVKHRTQSLDDVFVLRRRKVLLLDALEQSRAGRVGTGLLQGGDDEAGDEVGEVAIRDPPDGKCRSRGCARTEERRTERRKLGIRQARAAHGADGSDDGEDREGRHARRDAGSDRVLGGRMRGGPELQPGEPGAGPDRVGSHILQERLGYELQSDQ